MPCAAEAPYAHSTRSASCTPVPVHRCPSGPRRLRRISSTRPTAGGVDIIQLRDKSLEAAEELELLRSCEAWPQRHGRLWAVNDRADIASLAGAPVFHVGPEGPSARCRPVLARTRDAAIGLSTHSPEQVDAAIAAAAGPGGLDYFCVGPVWATPTKPGRAAVGLDLVRYAAAADAARRRALVRNRRHRPGQRGAGGRGRRPPDRGGPRHHRRHGPCRTPPSLLAALDAGVERAVVAPPVADRDSGTNRRLRVTLIFVSHHRLGSQRPRAATMPWRRRSAALRTELELPGPYPDDARPGRRGRRGRAAAAGATT